MASPLSNGDEKGNVFYSGHPTHEVVEDEITKPKFSGTGSLNGLAEHDENNNVAEPTSKSALKRKKVAPRQKNRRYPIRSSVGDSRILRSMSKTNNKTESKVESEPVNTPANLVMKRGRKIRKSRGASHDEFSMMRQRVRYLFTRMNYEQNLIDAYSGDGWKGQSAEKIKPEKELDRAKTEILRCKFKIRDLFQHLDSLSSVGRFDESLFDSEGRICSEDIFCAKCGSKDLSTDNDIILCDGVCNRGFHQKCLNPPLLSEDIPVGDEWWFCPACHCRLDCINILHQFQGFNISIKDEWTKLFPEVDAIANGDYQYSNRKESYFTSSSESSDTSNNKGQNENFGLPSDDSEDNDYDPDAPDITKSIQKDELSADESDFTSDSDEFCNELSKSVVANEDSASYLPDHKPFAQTDDGRGTTYINNSELQESELVSRKRPVTRLDYEKLYTETYGKSSSDSSDDEDWSQSNKGKKHGKRKESSRQSKAKGQTIHNYNNFRNVDVSNTEVDNNSSASVHRRLGETITQKLHQSFRENQYPSHEKKERLAYELGLTFRQVDKWFTNSRHSFRASFKEPLLHTRTPSLGIEFTRNGINSDINVVQSTLSNENKRKEPVPAEKVKVGRAELGKDGDNMKLLDRDRQKAVARELRRMKQGR